MLTEEMKKIIKTYPAGFAATVNADSTPNLSTKGTMVVLDDTHIIFAEIRSPNTLKNITHRPTMIVLFLDILARKCVRIKAHASVIYPDTDKYTELLPHFAAWPDLMHKIKHIIILHTMSAHIDLSPAYDVGEKEENLRNHWKNILAQA